MRVFFANQANLSGRFPDTRNWTNLVHFGINDNAFVGPAPNVENAPNLRQYLIHRNALTGPQPRTHPKAELEIYIVSQNLLTGPAFSMTASRACSIQRNEDDDSCFNRLDCAGVRQCTCRVLSENNTDPTGEKICQEKLGLNAAMIRDETTSMSTTRQILSSTTISGNQPSTALPPDQMSEVEENANAGSNQNLVIIGCSIGFVFLIVILVALVVVLRRNKDSNNKKASQTNAVVVGNGTSAFDSARTDKSNYGRISAATVGNEYSSVALKENNYEIGDVGI